MRAGLVMEMIRASTSGFDRTQRKAWANVALALFEGAHVVEARAHEGLHGDHADPFGRLAARRVADPAGGRRSQTNG